MVWCKRVGEITYHFLPPLSGLPITIPSTNWIQGWFELHHCITAYLFIAFFLSYILLNLIILFSVQQPPQTVNTRVIPSFPVHAFQQEEKMRWKSTTCLYATCLSSTYFSIFISDPTLASFSIILIDFDQNCFAIRATCLLASVDLWLCQTVLLSSTNSRGWWYGSSVTEYLLYH